MDTANSVYSPSPLRLDHMSSTISSVGRRKNKFDFKLNSENHNDDENIYTDNLILRDDTERNST